MYNFKIILMPFFVLACFLAACGDDAPVSGHTVGGTVVNLQGEGLRIRGAGDVMEVSGKGDVAFTLSEVYKEGDSYSVEVVSNPHSPEQLCIVQTEGGVVEDRHITDIIIICETATHQLCGKVENLEGVGLVLTEEESQGIVQPVGEGTVDFCIDGIEEGDEYSVVVTAEPASPSQSCQVDSGTGTMTAQGASEVTVNCETDQFTVSGTVVDLQGSGLILEEVNSGTTLHVQGTGQVDFDFPPMEDGSPYQIVVHYPPFFPYQECLVTAGDGAIDGEDVDDVQVSCVNETALLITEVGSAYYQGRFWFEIYNNTPVPIDLGDYALRAKSYDFDSSSFAGVRHFALDHAMAPPGEYMVIRTPKDFDHYCTGGSMVNVAGEWDPANPGYTSNDRIQPRWTVGDWGGFVEILEAPGGETVDFVHFGPLDPNSPTTSGHWFGEEAPMLPDDEAPDLHNNSLARDVYNTDTNSAADWTVREWATPGGPNDIPPSCVDDDDQDGIPDCAELSGSTYAGLDLYAWGARQGVPDIFLEIDHMDPYGSGTYDASLLPRQESMDRITALFASNGYAIHIDVGDLFDGNSGINPAMHDLGGGQQIPYTEFLCMCEGDPGVVNFHQLKADYQDVRRIQIFHYAVYGDEGSNGDAASAGIWGRGEWPGNDFMVVQGGSFTDDTPENFRRLINQQAKTTFHELGHNLGLGHGGDESRNRKPNYYSSMNYLYSYPGLPIIGNEEGDRFYYADSSCDHITSSSQLLRGPNSVDYTMDYSHGHGLDLDEAALDESLGLRQPGSTSVDWNCDGDETDLVSMDINFDSSIETLYDFDDWSYLDLFFSHISYCAMRERWHDPELAYGGGLIIRSPVSDDGQFIFPDGEVPSGMSDWVKPH